MFFSLLAACSESPGIYHDLVPPSAPVETIERTWATAEVELLQGRGELTLDVPSNTQGIFVAVTGVRNAEYLVHELEGPDGVVVQSGASAEQLAFGLGAATGPFFSPNRSVGDHGGTTLLVPNDPRIRLSPGSWRMGLLSTLDRTHRVRVDWVVSQAQHRPAATRLPLNIYLSGAGGMTLDQGLDHERLSRALALLERVYAQVDVEFSPIQLHAVSESFAQLQGIDLRSEEALELLAEGVGNEGVNLFVIERFEDEDDLLGTVGGVSAAIPGDPRGGAALSGVVVASSFSDADPQQDLLGVTMAHEIGHFLGLFHSEEAAGFQDNIGDTPMGDGQNLMHYHSRPSFTDLTPHQGMVVRIHPSMVAP